MMHPIHGHAQVFQQNIDLLGQVDVDGRRTDDGVAVAHGRGADTFVVLVFHGADGQLHILAVFGNLLEHRFIFFMVGNAPDHQGDVDGTQHLFDRGGCIRGAGIVPLGSVLLSCSTIISAPYSSTHFFAHAAGSETTSLKGSIAAAGHSSGTMSQISMATFGLWGISPSN
jgi:hypothetical protein